MSEGPDRDSRPVRDEPPTPAQLLWTSVASNLLAVLAALVWLDWRGRLDHLVEIAVGGHGPLVDLGVGVAVGLWLAFLFALAARRSTALQDFDASARRLLAGLGDTGRSVMLLAGVLGEEFLVRGAALDALGPIGAVALFLGVIIASGMTRVWLPALLGTTMLVALIESGFGLLATSVANAVLNHCNMRRLL
ncbi:MAG: hypothetical protein JNL12_11660 [Planctomycetes bacterium]|nr:hypothetical protein [Planctomycetota bacterium]